MWCWAEAEAEASYYDDFESYQWRFAARLSVQSTIASEVVLALSCGEIGVWLAEQVKRVMGKQ